FYIVVFKHNTLAVDFQAVAFPNISSVPTGIRQIHMNLVTFRNGHTAVQMTINQGNRNPPKRYVLYPTIFKFETKPPSVAKIKFCYLFIGKFQAIYFSASSIPMVPELLHSLLK